MFKDLEQQIFLANINNLTSFKDYKNRTCYNIVYKLNLDSSDLLNRQIIKYINNKELKEKYVDHPIETESGIKMPTNNLSNYSKYYYRKDDLGDYIELQLTFFNKYRLY